MGRGGALADEETERRMRGELAALADDIRAELDARVLEAGDIVDALMSRAARLKIEADVCRRMAGRWGFGSGRGEDG